MLLAQITDSHVALRTGYHVDTVAALVRCVEQIQKLDPLPDACLITGDLVDCGTADEYRMVREIFSRLSMPWFAIPGNHDEREAFRVAFADQRRLAEAGGFLHYAIEDLALRIIALDTVVPGHTEGTLCSERLEWLAAKLAEAPERPTIIMMHHPPFRTGASVIDEASFTNREALGELISRYWNIEAILCGHLHRAMQTRFFGTLASTAPSTAHQLALDFRPDAKLSFTLEPPGFQLHAWQPGQSLVTHTICVGQFVGPFPF